MHAKPIPLPLTPTELARLWSRIDTSAGPTACWPWTGWLTGSGYGELPIRSIRHSAHRVVYTILVGPVALDRTLDHVCKVRHCCNPTHMEPVTNRENLLRGTGAPARNARKTRCPRGHPYDAVRRRGWRRERYCRTCKRDRARTR